MSTIYSNLTTNHATMLDGARLVDRCKNGVIWACVWDGDTTYGTLASKLRFIYSTDDGATWVDNASNALSSFYGGSDARYTPPAVSIFISRDPATGNEAMHAVYKEIDGATLMYSFGTFNAARTAITWSSPVQIESGYECHQADLVAHWHSTAWKVHITYATKQYVGDTKSIFYKRLNVTTGGAVTTETTTSLGGMTDTTYPPPMSPTIDFHHTGDGKSVKGSAPHVFIAFMTPTHAGGGIIFRRVAYSGSAWTVEAGVTISANYAANDRLYGGWVNLLFDGTAAVIAGFGYKTDGTYDTFVFERDVANTTTTQIAVEANVTTANRLANGTVTYDSQRNLYFFGNEQASSFNFRDVCRRKWHRASKVFGAKEVLDTGTNGGYGRVSSGRNANGYLDYIWQSHVGDGSTVASTVEHGGGYVTRPAGSSKAIKINGLWRWI